MLAWAFYIMKIVNLVEDTSNSNFIPVHGLSFYIETKTHKILFDLGPDDTLFKNAEIKSVDLTAIDTVIISHGHYDHGGALKEFLDINTNAKIYIQKNAFEKYYSIVEGISKYVGIDETLKDNSRIMLLEGNIKVDDELYIFVSGRNDKFKSEANNTLYSAFGLDNFKHEQNLLISEDFNVLIVGCGHSGITNILGSIDIKPDYCIGGFHVYNPSTKKTVPISQLEQLSNELKDYSTTKFYTCHCTGIDAYKYLNSKCNNIQYISCGEELSL